MGMDIEQFGLFKVCWEKCGGSIPQTATMMGVSEKTVKKYVRQMQFAEFLDAGKEAPAPIIQTTTEKIDTNDVVMQVLRAVQERIPTRDSLIDVIREEVQKENKLTIEIKKPTGEVKTLDVTLPEVFPKILALAQARRNILLVGPAGCGKTFIAEKIAEALDLSFHSLSVSIGMSESQLAGWLVPTGDGGKFEYRRSSFVQAFEEGGVFLLDEVDAGDANTMTFINTALANNFMGVPNRYNNPVAKKHEDFVCIAAANTYGTGADRMYVGRNQLDEATLDRFRVGTVEMDYDLGVERSLVRPDVLEWGLTTRARVRSSRLRRNVSTRFLRDLTVMANSAPEYYGARDQWKAVLTSGWTPDEVAHV